MILQQLVLDRVRGVKQTEIAGWTLDMVQKIAALNALEREEEGLELGPIKEKASESNSRKPHRQLLRCKRLAQYSLEGSSKNNNFMDCMASEAVERDSVVLYKENQREIGTPEAPVAQLNLNNNDLIFRDGMERSRSRGTRSWKKDARWQAVPVDKHQGDNWIFMRPRRRALSCPLLVHEDTLLEL